MVERRSYNTRQKKIIGEFLANNQDHYLSVDEIYARLAQQNESPGRTTVYRLAGKGQEYGQLVCICCGKVIPFDCDALVNFASHVHNEHKFVVDLMRSVMYGYCSDCTLHQSPAVHDKK